MIWVSGCTVDIYLIRSSIDMENPTIVTLFNSQESLKLLSLCLLLSFSIYQLPN